MRSSKKAAAPRQDWRKHAEHRGRQNLELRQALGRIEKLLRDYLMAYQDPSAVDPVETTANSPAWQAWSAANTALREPHVE